LAGPAAARRERVDGWILFTESKQAAQSRKPTPANGYSYLRRSLAFAGVDIDRGATDGWYT
jgi:hypothetical protein